MNLSVYMSTFIDRASFVLFSRRFISHVLLAISCQHLEGIPLASVPTVEKSALNGIVGMSLAVRLLGLCVSDAGGTGSIPGCESKIIQAKKKLEL